MLKIKQVLFLMFGVTSFIIFYMGFLSFITTSDKLIGTIMLGFSGIVSLGTLIGTFYISRNITNPIDELINKMNEFSQNNKTTKETKTSHGIHELQYLHKNFHKMTGMVGKTIEKEKKLNRQLQEMDKRKIEFMSMMSHELKTPIMPILGYVQLLKKQELLGELNDQQLDAINEIHLATIRLQKLIQDVLTAQKIDLEKLNITKDTLESNEVIDLVYKAFSPICKIKNVHLEKNSENHQIVSDSDRICQVFSNLISNALEFVPEHGGKIEIGSYGQEESVVFFVRDNGHGISFEEQQNIFKKFYQVDASLKRKKEGSGLGLSICEGIVKALDGKIWVESRVNSGAIFYFRLPKKTIQLHHLSNCETIKRI
ncbi:MAG: HAMP domain-containing histidine kinase [Nitrosarchaeum sp.]|nr:HAMP domain-containing histidine kinase [Nitrosarchaeum sp.]